MRARRTTWPRNYACLDAWGQTGVPLLLLFPGEARGVERGSALTTKPRDPSPKPSTTQRPHAGLRGRPLAGLLRGRLLVGLLCGRLLVGPIRGRLVVVAIVVVGSTEVRVEVVESAEVAERGLQVERAIEFRREVVALLLDVRGLVERRAARRRDVPARRMCWRRRRYARKRTTPARRGWDVDIPRR